MKTLNELFDKPVKFKNVERDKDYYTYEFEIDGKRYIVTMIFNSQYQWEVFFSLRNYYAVGKAAHQGSMGIQDVGDEIKVFSTVVSILKDWIGKVDPEVWFVEAKEPSRKRLYETMIKKLASGKYKIVKSLGKRYTMYKK